MGIVSDKKIKGDIAFTFLARGVTAFSSVILVMMIGKFYGLKQLGFFAIAQSVILGVSIICRYGMNNTLVYYIGRDPKSDSIISYLVKAISLSSLISLFPIAMLLLYGDSFLSAFIPGLSKAQVVFIASSSVLFSLSFIFSGFLKGVKKPVSAVLLENGSVAIVMIVLILVDLGFDKNTDIVFLYSASIFSVFLLGCGQVVFYLVSSRSPWDKLSPKGYDVTYRDFIKTSTSYFIISLANFCQNVLVFIIAGYFLGEAEVGLLKSAQQIALTLSFVLVVTNSIFPPRFAELFKNGKIDELERLARFSCKLGFFFSLPLVIVFLGFSEGILRFVGDDFVKAQYLLYILTISQFVNVVSGNVNFVLNMTGHEVIMRNIVLSTSAIGLLFFSLLVIVLGEIGAAIGIALMVISQNIIAVFFSRHLLNIEILPLKIFSFKTKGYE
ncbi:MULTISPECIES: lipopolysaccharide biosynthesis protein [Halomonas]|uniref:Polysaccharide biosynthesis protein C-terminal domain-containing protein n=1 Tax=Halomonas halophila TaxID=29573 RepID=A0ABQ0U5L1_9GAMM|nr:MULTISPECIES: oligosaccharide flippase family protein [Halomonas]MDR5890196.1 oligosaccharide flippase family protein [Halomonas salina]WJY05885.1 oligosaccharide flippase family protein [Halomonas halophila]GEK73660.1 hypothetical protein HHA04nite_22040 [Halomonas halophila]